MKQMFYHATTRKIIVVFASIFDNIRFQRNDGKVIKVPIHYSPKIKFIDNIINSDMDEMVYDTTLPRMGFELAGLNYASERAKNPLHKIPKDEEGEGFVYDRIAYDFNVELNIATVKFEDSLQIVEQIFPFFTPGLNVTFYDMPEFGLETNMAVVLNSASIDQSYEGSAEIRRVVLWNLQFTVKGYFYSDIREQQRIKKSILSFSEMDFETKFETYMAEVVPEEANKDDPHEIVEGWVPNE